MSESPLVKVDEALTRKVANLARLELTDPEVKLFTQQIGDILKYVNQLQTIDVSGVEPFTHPLVSDSSMREDLAVVFPLDAHGKSKILSAAPDIMNDGFKVPPIL
jgi:aspartyl-tRNA(Asn)/glutamyl-tRNA(Gln) amidotransferase subunit C